MRVEVEAELTSVRMNLLSINDQLWHALHFIWYLVRDSTIIWMQRNATLEAIRKLIKFLGDVLRFGMRWLKGRKLACWVRHIRVIPLRREQWEPYYPVYQKNKKWQPGRFSVFFLPSLQVWRAHRYVKESSISKHVTLPLLTLAWISSSTSRGMTWSRSNQVSIDSTWDVSSQAHK